MYAIAAGLVVLGVLCGAMVRLMPFAIILVIAAVITVIAAWPRPGGEILLNMAVTVVALQVGYAAGIVARAMLHSWRHRQSRTPRKPSERDMRLPTEQRHR